MIPHKIRLTIGDLHRQRPMAFAEVTGAALLAGEIAISAALANGTFVEAHRRSRAHVGA